MLRQLPQSSLTPTIVPLWLIILAFLSSSVHSLSTSASTAAARSTKIQVWDNVLPVSTQRLVHDTAVRQNGRRTGHTLFDCRNDPPASPLEAVLQEIVEQWKDTSSESSGAAQYIEYWTRQEWRHIEAHADIDEYHAKTMSTTTPDAETFRYPTAGHVLYLQVGPKVRGPTCLFPQCTTGGDLAIPTATKKRNGQVVTVPAVAGRLLRFPGSWLHAVPRPTDLWMLPFVQGSPDFASDYERSVVLFNTWASDRPPEQVPKLSEIDPEEAKAYLHDNDETHGGLVNSLDTWQSQDVVSSLDTMKATTDDDDSDIQLDDRVKVWLLGDRRRRNYTMRTVPVYTHGAALRQALYDPHQPQSTPWSSTAPTPVQSM